MSRSAHPKELEEAAAILAEKERSAAEIILPGVEKLRQNLTRRASLDAELDQALQTNLDSALAWLSRYRDTREALIELAARQRAGVAEVLHARPLTGDIDHGALSREFMARFPKIRATLAK